MSAPQLTTHRRDLVTDTTFRLTAKERRVLLAACARGKLFQDTGYDIATTGRLWRLGLIVAQDFSLLWSWLGSSWTIEPTDLGRKVADRIVRERLAA